MSTTRRQILAGLAASVPAASVAAGASAQQSEQSRANRPRNFVLAHGTWHGGWAWRDVRNILEDKGHRVFTPTLTGCGERVHLSRPDVGLETHIEDIANVLRFEELSDVVLVGHSFTGLAITGVADRLKERLRHLVFFDALVPAGNRMSGVPRDAEGNLPEWWREREARFIDGYKMDLWADYPIDMLVPPDSPHAARIKRLITTHPAKTWTDELVLENGGWRDVPRSFIHCVGQQYRKSSEAMVGAARGEGWNFLELDIPRDGMITDPELVANVLENIAHG